jgi:hypothetical protein
VDHYVLVPDSTDGFDNVGGDFCAGRRRSAGRICFQQLGGDKWDRLGQCAREDRLDAELTERARPIRPGADRARSIDPSPPLKIREKGVNTSGHFSSSGR